MKYAACLALLAVACAKSSAPFTLRDLAPPVETDDLETDDALLETDDAGDDAAIDLATPDLGTPDLAAPDLVTADLAAPSDFKPASDLELAADLTSASDLVVVRDLAPPPDFAVAPDLAPRPDLTPPPDLMTPPGTQSTGQPCEQGSFGACVPSDTCVVVSTSQPLDLCYLDCTSDASCTNGGRCAITLTNNATVCTEPVNGCDPVTQNACGGAQGCFVLDGKGDTGCHLAGKGQELDPCATDYDCAPGFACFPSDGGCLPLCHAGNDADCPPWDLCWGVTGWTQWGACN